MEYQDEKRRLFESLVLHGKERGEVLQGDCPVPAYLAAKWIRNFYDPPDQVRLSPTPRLFNRFSVGADPELAFFDIAKKYVHSENLGMDTLAACGSDMSGRQAELRAKPSRFVLDVVASMQEALRWMGATYPTNTLTWLATPYVQCEGHHDGCGGHVHLGRKRSGVTQEIKKLDMTNQLLLAASVLDQEGNTLRCDRTKYGRYDDYRIQNYGYEYRTFSTWISDPLTAYLVITVAKLMVLHPAIPCVRVRAAQQIKNLLC